MRISSKGRYALRVMLYMAVNDSKAHISVRDIANKLNIFNKYLEQILSILSKSGLVRGMRGSQGGYCLCKKPEEYTVGEILRLLEGDLSPIDGLNDNFSNENLEKEKDTIWIYIKMNDAINSVVDNITLADMVEKQNENFEALFI